MDDFKFGREELGGTSVFQVKLREKKKPGISGPSGGLKKRFTP